MQTQKKISGTEVFLLLLMIVSYVLLYLGDASWWWYIFPAVIVGALMMGDKKKQLADEDEQRLKILGIETINFIPVGTYLGGHPDIDQSVPNVKLYFNNGKLDIYATLDMIEKVETKKFSHIELTSINDITIEDKSTLDKRITLGRAVMFGVLSLAMQKTETKHSAFLVIDWSDGQFNHNSIFQLPTFEAANTARNRLIKIVKAKPALNE